MFDPISRRGFVGLAAVAGALSVTRTSWARQTPPSGSSTGASGGAGSVAIGDVFPTTEPALAREIVGASHANIDRVRELLAEDRGLALAVWDWGFGDWESALGAASHVGRKEIAELLMAHGARADLFALAMLDRVDAVRAVCEAMPGIQKVRGPHGITLMRHAQAGEAARVEEYLTALGGADEREPDLGLEESAAAAYAGAYAAGSARFEVKQSRMGGIELTREGGSARRMCRVGEHRFSPVGAPQVEVVFVVEGERAKEFAVVRGVELVRAGRVG